MTISNDTRVLAGPRRMERLGTVVGRTTKFGEPTYVVRFDHSGMTTKWRASRVRPYREVEWSSRSACSASP